MIEWVLGTGKSTSTLRAAQSQPCVRLSTGFCFSWSLLRTLLEYLSDLRLRPISSEPCIGVRPKEQPSASQQKRITNIGALRQASEERRGRCGGDLRGGDAPLDAVRQDTLDRQPGRADAPQGARDAGAPAHPDPQRPARSS